MKHLKKRTKTLLLSCVLVAAAAVGIVLAYLNDSGSKDNIFRIGNVDIVVTEPDYPEDISSRVMVPHSIVPKNPKIKNVGENDAFVFMKVTVPLIEAEPVKSDNMLKNPFTFEGAQRIPGNETMEIFKMISDAPVTAETETVPDSITDQAEKNLYSSDWYMLDDFMYNGNWCLIDKTDNGDNTKSYLFAYRRVLVTEANATHDYSITETEPLFDKIQLKSFVEDEDYYGSIQKIKIESYAIQSNDLMSVTNFNTQELDQKNPEKWQLKRIYNTYFNQASGVMAS